MESPVAVKVVALAAVNAGLVTAGVFFQKLNDVRGGSIGASWILALAAACMIPTFWVTNVVYAMKGKMSVYNPSAAAMHFVMVTLVARFYFAERITTTQIGGLGLIIVGLLLLIPAQ